MSHPCTVGCYLAAMYGPGYKCVGRCIEDDYSGDDSRLGSICRVEQARALAGERLLHEGEQKTPNVANKLPTEAQP